MYEKFGYTVYRRVLDYYSGGQQDEDAFGMSSKILPLLNNIYFIW